MIAPKPIRDKLMDEFGTSSTQLIADIDCTAGGKPLCDENSVRGYPTLKWGSPDDLQDYNGGRSFDDLKSFATENLKPLCSVKNLDLCDEDKNAQIQKFMDMDAETLKKAVAAEEKKIEDAEENFKAEVNKLQEAYTKLNTEKEEIVAQVKAGGLGLMKSVSKFKDSPDTKDEL